jgi:hypothetical protein
LDDIAVDEIDKDPHWEDPTRIGCGGASPPSEFVEPFDDVGDEFCVLSSRHLHDTRILIKDKKGLISSHPSN